MGECYNIGYRKINIFKHWWYRIKSKYFNGYECSYCGVSCCASMCYNCHSLKCECRHVTTFPFTYQGFVNYCHNRSIPRGMVEQGFGKVIFRVPKKHLNKAKEFVLEYKSAAVDDEILPLRWWECRVKKFKLREGI